MSIARVAEPSGSLQEAKEWGLDREDSGGVEPWRIFANQVGHADGLARGREGNVHTADHHLGPVAMVSRPPAMLPVAVGCALAFRIREEKRVAVGWFGEGSAARSGAHEAMNLAPDVVPGLREVASH